eukprot:SAG31_NODE_2401_length_5771_cov_90.513223_2_plen_137_part_00
MNILNLDKFKFSTAVRHRSGYSTVDAAQHSPTETADHERRGSVQYWDRCRPQAHRTAPRQECKSSTGSAEQWPLQQRCGYFAAFSLDSQISLIVSLHHQSASLPVCIFVASTPAFAAGFLGERRCLSSTVRESSRQ